MSVRVLIADYNSDRMDHLEKLLKLRFPDYDVDKLKTNPPNPPRDLDVEKLRRVGERPYQLLIGHIGGNPSGQRCLKEFKQKHRTGKAVLYTKQSNIPIDDLDDLKLADKIFERSADENKLFDDADKMFDIINNVMQGPPVNTARLLSQEPVVIGAVITGVLTFIVGLIAAVLSYLKPVAHP